MTEFISKDSDVQVVCSVSAAFKATETSSGRCQELTSNSCAQAPGDPAADWRLLPQPDGPDQDHLRGLLLQPPVCGPRPHPAQVRRGLLEVQRVTLA